jgi:hypothetical protein
MLDSTAIAALASTAVSMLAPLLQKMAEGGAAEAGKSVVSGLLEKLKKGISHEGSQEAFEDLANSPVDADAQGALRLQLRKAMETGPEFAAFLRQWVGDSKSELGIAQSATVTGNNNTTTQITGSGNIVR